MGKHELVVVNSIILGKHKCNNTKEQQVQVTYEMIDKV